MRDIFEVAEIRFKLVTEVQISVCVCVCMHVRVMFSHSCKDSSASQPLSIVKRVYLRVDLQR